MPTDKLAWYPMYAKDATSDMALRMMTSAERGMYWMLLNAQWMEDGLPDDKRKLALLAMEEDRSAFNAAWVGTLEPLFPIGSDGLRRNPRLERVAREQRSKRKQRIKIAKGAADARWGMVAEQKERDEQEAALAEAVDTWLDQATSARRKAMLARAKKKVVANLGLSNGEVGDTTRAHLERAALALMLKELGEI